MPEDRRPSKFNRQPVLWLAVAFALGILAARVGDLDVRIVVAAAIALAVAGFLFRSKAVSSWLILTAFAFAGTASAIVETQNVSPNRLKILYENGTLTSSQPVEVEGVLLGRPEASIDGVILNLAVEKLKHRGADHDGSGNVRLFLQIDERRDGYKSQISDLKYGSRLRIATKLERDDEFLNPGVIRKREILDRLGVDATGTIKSQLLVEKIADESIFLPLAWVYDRRAMLIEDFRANLSGPAAGVMIASLLGNKQFLDRSTGDLFRDGGTFHILVISGLHITFIGGLLLLFLRQITRKRWVQFIVTTVVLWAYTLAVGADVPVVRAALMFTVMLFSYVIYRRGSLLNSLGLCGLILLVWRPSDLLNPSFQLTFVSVAAIVAIAYPLIENLRKIGGWMPTSREPFPPSVPDWLSRSCETLYWSSDKWNFESRRQIWTAGVIKGPLFAGKITGSAQSIVRYLFEGVLVSLIVQICMLPLSVVYFHRVSVISVLLNLWVGLFIAFESFAAVIGVVVNQFSSILARAFFAFAEVFNWLMLLLPRLFAENSWLSFRLPAYEGYGRVIYFMFAVPVIIFAVALYRWKPFAIGGNDGKLKRLVLFPATVALILLVGLIVFHPFSSPRPDGRLRIDFLDVGQGDSALVTFPDGRTMLVDGGGRINYKNSDDEIEPFERDVRGIGESIVSEFLWYRGYSRIDLVVGTHAHADHIQGLTDVAKNFRIGAAIFGRTPVDDLVFGELDEVLERRGIPVETIAAGDALKFGDVLVEVLYPPAHDLAGASANDNSLVLRIVYGDRAFLLTGDIERLAETTLASGGALSADVVKVPHHGSRTSSTAEFVRAVGAEYAIISVGRSSPFGHPHEEVVRHWTVVGSRVMTTGERGMISVSTDGTDLVIDRFAN